MRVQEAAEKRLDRGLPLATAAMLHQQPRSRSNRRCDFSLPDLSSAAAVQGAAVR